MNGAQLSAVGEAVSAAGEAQLSIFDRFYIRTPPADKAAPRFLLCGFIIPVCPSQTCDCLMLTPDYRHMQLLSRRAAVVQANRCAAKQNDGSADLYRWCLTTQ